MSNYVREMIDRINEEIPGLDPALSGLYALLAFTKGTDTSLEDVHDAWAVWTATVRGRPDHAALVPFGELDEQTQELDREYAEGIHRAARAAKQGPVMTQQPVQEETVTEKAILCADLVLFDQRQPVQVLMIKRRRAPYEGAWALPGGHVDPGETFRQAAIREAQEETGLVVLDVRQVGIYDTPNRDPRGRVVSVAFSAVVTDGARPVAGDDAEQVAWIPARQVISGEIPVAFDHHRIVVDAYQLGGQ